jgi:hypothetical protein
MASESDWVRVCGIGRGAGWAGGGGGGGGGGIH